MQIDITKDIALKNLRKYLNETLKDWADKFDIAIYKNGRRNKGWTGKVLERLAGLSNSNEKASNGKDFELKSIRFSLKNEPKETMAITMINQCDLMEKGFFESHLWEKLKSLIVCGVYWGEKNEDAKLLFVTSIGLNKEDELTKAIEKDYELIRNKAKNDGFDTLSGKDGNLIQARTKGKGHGSKTRAFYARKEMIKILFEKGNKG